LETERESGRPMAPPSNAAIIGLVVKEHCRFTAKPAQTRRDFALSVKIFLLFPLPVKVTTRGDKEE